MAKSSINIPKVYVLHIKKGYEQRGLHMQKMLGKLDIPFEFILDGDMTDLTPEFIGKYFSGRMAIVSPATSCATKHILAYLDMIEHGITEALIFEDDIMLHKDFVGRFNQSITELHSTISSVNRPTMISYEDTRLRFVPRSKRKPGKVLYPGTCDRMAGAYYINLSAAQLIIDYATNTGMDQPIDIIHNLLLKQKQLDYYWIHPTIATQGSHFGTFSSAINIKNTILTNLSFRLQRIYKRVLYEFR